MESNDPNEKWGRDYSQIEIKSGTQSIVKVERMCS